MTKEWYKYKGYELSSLIEDNKITSSEEAVVDAYLLPLGLEPSQNEDLLGALAFVFILQQNAFATRAGAKVKTSMQSMNANDNALTAYKKKAINLLTNVADDLSKCSDICDLFFKNQFFYQ